MFESYDHAESSFITLTYDDYYLPENAGLDVKDWQKFAHRLRKYVWRNYAKKIRFYMCGEYGYSPTTLNNIGRPHFHAIIFGHAFHEDRYIKREKPHEAFSSDALQDLWGKGITELSDMTVETAAYVASYTVKKITGDLAKEHYVRLNEQTGEIVNIRPEFSTMSRGGEHGGIGRRWYEQYKKDLHKGFVTIDGKTFPVPKFYQNIMSEDDAWALEQMREQAKMNRKEASSQEKLRALEAAQIELQKEKIR